MIVELREQMFMNFRIRISFKTPYIRKCIVNHKERHNCYELPNSSFVLNNGYFKYKFNWIIVKSNVFPNRLFNTTYCEQIWSDT